MPQRGLEREAITSADKLLRMGGYCSRSMQGKGEWDLISGGRFLMQGDPRGIKTAGLITVGCCESGVYLLHGFKVQVKENHHIIYCADHLA